MTTKAYIISAKRSIVAPIGGALAALEVHDLAAPVITDCLKTAHIKSDQVDELILSNALYGGGNPARLAALAAELPEKVAGLSIDRQCVGGLDAILLAANMVKSGAADIVIAGGVESYSRRPVRHKTFTDGSAPEAYDRPPFTPWADRDPEMHIAAGDLASHLSISQADQDTWTIESHAKALQHADQLFHEVTPVAGLSDTSDPYARPLTHALCKRAKPLSGTVTSANTATAADAAAFCVVVSEEALKNIPNSKAIEIGPGATVGADPTLPGLAPVAAIKAIGADKQTFTHIEIMEAYAAQAIACTQEAGLDPTKVNQKGGALARGHPIGASGTILAVRLYNDLLETGGTGLVAIAAAGGIGTALQLKS
ncbi:acetyl-CoA C-acyltransferase [Amylibacter sp. SFDW26]|uniref:acetyl-CoA C-acyltransferase n=1 Tax=Amylibacter sp. SFDW26 TaxID=2652722 RepID=UPI0012629DCF|nr:acetyl-CoA C-acyltransferase [Amylibacter sp. SFDW26]KAB7616318.1 acetyl-CoA C-acyltransferase [Amylibacter sp. SFDW26]